MSDAQAANAEPISEVDKLREELRFLRTCGIIEIAARNANVAEYMRHWEMRAEKAEAALRRSPSSPGAMPVAFQSRVQPWMMACFGEEISRDRVERNHRFIEEALELVQANDTSRSEAHQLVDYVFDRPAGELHQEIGGVMVTLAALCLASNEDMHAAGEAELARVWTKVEVIRAKQAAKPKHSPLPQALAGELVEKLNQLVSLNEERNGGPYGGHAAAACMSAMSEAATRIAALAAELERVKRDLEEAKAATPHFYYPSTMHMGDCRICGNDRDAPQHNADWKARAEAAEAELERVKRELSEIDAMLTDPDDSGTMPDVSEYPTTITRLEAILFVLESRTEQLNALTSRGAE
jgi:hypothetical protein